jgi:hypothetical protein
LRRSQRLIGPILDPTIRGCLSARNQNIESHGLVLGCGHADSEHRQGGEHKEDEDGCHQGESSVMPLVPESRATAHVPYLVEIS